MAIPLETIVQRSDCGHALTSPAEIAGENNGTDTPDFYPGADVHLFLQGTAGIGKSVMATVLTQYLITHGSSVRCIDADPVNRTFSKYEGLRVERIELTEGGIVNTKRLDVLVNTILSANDKLVVDCGASIFAALQNHFRKAHLFARLTRAGSNVHIHTVVTRGQEQDDTLDRFRELTQDEGTDRRAMVWANEYFGPIEWDEKAFCETDLYQNRKDKLLGLITFPRRTAETFGHDVDLMIARHQTFTEAIHSADISIMARHRLERVRDDLFKQLDAVWPVSLPGAA